MRVIIKRHDGGISIMRLLDEEPDVEIEKWREIHVGAYHSHRFMPDDSIPVDRTFRNAWCDVTPEAVIDIDMTKARELHRAHMRRVRAPKLAALDIEMSRAFRDAAKRKRIEAKRQALRDVTADPAIDAAKTPEELKAVIPAVLRDA